MRAEIISIGDEITSGQRLDTNSQWLSQQLRLLGHQVVYHTTVANDLEANTEVFRHAMQRTDIVIATGGLGPTADDLTREALSRALGKRLELHEPSLEYISQLFARRGRKMPPRNKVQAMFPQGSRPIANPHGTAPGICVEVPRQGTPPCILIALPGVPAEMIEMWELSVQAILREKCPSAHILVNCCIKCFGAGESHVEGMLPDLIRRGRNPSVGITVSQATISLRIIAQGTSEEECRELIEADVATIHQSLGDLVFGEGEDELEDVVMRLLKKRDATLASLEWGTDGLLAMWLSRASGENNGFLGGSVIRVKSMAGSIFPKLVHTESLVTTTPDLMQSLARQWQHTTGAHWVICVGSKPETTDSDSAECRTAIALVGPNCTEF